MSGTDISRSKASWRKEAKRNADLLQGTRLLLACIVHLQGGEISISPEIIKELSDGDYQMEAKRGHPLEDKLIVITTSLPTPDVDPQQNES